MHKAYPSVRFGAPNSAKVVPAPSSHFHVSLPLPVAGIFSCSVDFSDAIGCLQLVRGSASHSGMVVVVVVLVVVVVVTVDPSPTANSESDEVTAQMTLRTGSRLTVRSTNVPFSSCKI